MQNPEIIRKPTPNGGDYSELWLLDKDGNPVADPDTATHYKILELTDGGDIVQSTYGVFDK